MGAARIVSFGSLAPEHGGTVRGGVATFHSTLISEPAANVVAVVAPDHDPAAVPVPAYSPGRGEDRRALLSRILREHRPDVALFNAVPGGWPTLWRQVAPDRPSIGVIHSWHRLTLAAEEDRPRIREEIQSALDELSAVVFGSEHCRREGQALGFSIPERAETIVYPLQQAFATPLDVSRQRSGIVFLGSLQRRKDPYLLVDAAPLLRDAPIVFAGEGAEEPGLRDRAEHLGQTGRIEFVGHRPAGEHIPFIRDLLARAEVMCLPSRSESFGLVFIEALACGTPVVGFAPTVDEIARLAGQPVGEGITADAPQQLAAAIERVRDADWDREALRNASVARFAAAAAAEKYAQLAAAVAGGGRAAT